jgi:4-amino-4-deoxy-L-arabinose transferase-like glycosyltransferase
VFEALMSASAESALPAALRSMASAPRLLALGCLVAYLALSLSYLDVFPMVGEDEPWIAAAPVRLAEEGVYGSELFTGYYGVERHNYQHQPVYPLLQAGVFKVFGVSVRTMRLLPVAFGLALLVAVFLIGRQAGDERVGALAVLLMVSVSVAVSDRATGILFLDRVRINRYDIAVPVFGLFAMWAFNRAWRGQVATWYAPGVLTGLASLSHLYGIFWLPVFLLPLLRRRGWSGLGERPVWQLLAGCVAPWLPWAGYVASGWTDYVGQMRFVAPRFDLLSPSFYLDNVLHGGGPISGDWAVYTLGSLSADQIGAWTMVIAVPLAVGAMLWPAAGRRQPAAALLAASLVTQTLLFLLLLAVKTVNYMIALWPMAVLCVAWLGVRVWDRRGVWPTRLAAVVLAVAVVGEGVARITAVRKSAAATTSYEWFTGEVARCIPEGSRVLGLQHYWLGLRQYPFRTWVAAINFATPLYYHEPMTLDDALERIDPDVVLIDRYMAQFFRDVADPADPLHRFSLGFERFLARRGATERCVVDGRDYGEMRVIQTRQP